MGGAKPDQRLSNVYKMYRAMRPGPDSPISPKDQLAFYDPGLGTGESGRLFGRVKSILESAVGTGIDHNIIDCFEQIIAHYEPGDRVLLFGFSRGAYTVRALPNVMNLCCIPTQMPDGKPVPRHGPVYGRSLRMQRNSSKTTAPESLADGTRTSRTAKSSVADSARSIRVLPSKAAIIRATFNEPSSECLIQWCHCGLRSCAR